MSAFKPKGLFILDRWAYENLYGDELGTAVEERLHLIAAPMTAAHVAGRMDVLQDVEVIMSGWGMCTMDEEFLAAAPNLQAVFHGAGSIKPLVTDAFWRRGIHIVSAYPMNAVPVAEYTLATILLSLKQVWRYALAMQRQHRYFPKTGVMAGAYRSTVGLVSLGAVGRRVVELLKEFDLHVLAHDPLCPPESARSLGVDLVTLDELFRRSQVVSLHTPWLPETEGLITGRHVEMMREGATLINTARGIIVREREMLAVLARRPDLTAVIDVTYPEPPNPDSLLFTLPNVVLTPHIAGAMDGECRRLGRFLVDELDRYLEGDISEWRLGREQLSWMA